MPNSPETQNTEVATEAQEASKPKYHILPDERRIPVTLSAEILRQEYYDELEKNQLLTADPKKRFTHLRKVGWLAKRNHFFNDVYRLVSTGSITYGLIVNPEVDLKNMSNGKWIDPMFARLTEAAHQKAIPEKLVRQMKQLADAAPAKNQTISEQLTMERAAIAHSSILELYKAFQTLHNHPQVDSDDRTMWQANKELINNYLKNYASNDLRKERLKNLAYIYRNIIEYRIRSIEDFLDQNVITDKKLEASLSAYTMTPLAPAESSGAKRKR
jgi:hypothetical protein